MKEFEVEEGIVSVVVTTKEKREGGVQERVLYEAGKET